MARAIPSSIVTPLFGWYTAHSPRSGGQCPAQGSGLSLLRISMVICAFSCAVPPTTEDSFRQFQSHSSRGSKSYLMSLPSRISQTLGGVGNGDLVQPVVPVDKHGAFDAQIHQHARHGLHQVLVINAEQDIIRLCRICERAEDVEHRAHADLLAGCGGKTHGTVERLGKQERQPAVCSDICAAWSGVMAIFMPSASSTSAAPLRLETLRLPCLATRSARARGDKCRCGGDVKGARHVAACAHDVDGIRASRHGLSPSGASRGQSR